ncbi:MAG: hypothetical protein QMD13_06215 [Candidatus Bathyarchaeia archaeon]|nr:hypothetical protein [Candidatus Bathyarchaeia archaeon]
MPFFIDDIFLRMLGISIPPFDMIWLMETIRDYVEEIREEETQQKINNRIKENRLLYELGEITKEEYERRNGELNHKLRMNNRINRTTLNHRINILG